jgi:hypothetical protein
MLNPEKQTAILSYFEKLKQHVTADYLGWQKDSEFAKKNVPALTLQE